MTAGHQVRREDVDLLFLYVTTYALSSTVLPIVQRGRVPVVVLNLSPSPAIDYAWFNNLKDRTRMTGEWLASCSACPVPEIANVFRRAGIRFFQITGVLSEEPIVDAEIDSWIEAGRVASVKAEYERRHNPIWAELADALKAHGVSNYSICLHPGTHQLFAYAEIENEESWQAIASTPICRRWWDFMADLMEVNPDHSPVVAPLREVFHLE